MRSFKLLFLAAITLIPAVFVSAQKPVRTAPNAPIGLFTERLAPKDRDEALRSAKAEPKGGDTAELISGSTYGFAATTAAMEDMSSGTTTLVAASQDDTASAVTSIGFEVWMDGVRYTQFSANANGLMGLGAVAVNNGASGRTNDFATATNNPKMTGYWEDMCTSAAGRVHYKVIGAPGSRKLVVEWLNLVQFDNVAVACSATVRGTVQVWLFEGTGVIQTVTSGMTFNDVGDGYSVGIGSGVASFGSVTTATNSVSYAASSNANVAPMASGTSYVFTPNVPNAPTNNGVTGITATGLTINWNDTSSNEVGFAVYRSTDGVNFTFVGQTAANAISFPDSGLTPATNYFYRVSAVSEGAVSAVASFSTATAAAGSDTCNGAGGNWSAAGTWLDGTPPTVGDNVTIGAGCTVTIDVLTAVALNVTVANGGTLQYDAAVASSLATTDVTIDSGGTFRSAVTGTITTHALTLTGNLTNNGTLDFSTNADTAGVVITFTGASNNTFGGTGATTDVRTITVNKGVTNVNTLELNPTNFTVRGVTTDTVVGGFLVLTNGTFKVSGTFTLTSRVFSAAAYTIGATQGFWLNNPNFTVAGQNGSPTLTGLLRVSQGTYNIGTATGNSMGFSTGSTIIVEGGAINATGRFGVAAAANVINYTQSGGTITVCTVGNASATLGSFDLGTALASVINMTNGTIVTQLAATAIDYRNQAGTGITAVTGGTLQLGNAASGAAKTFNLRGVLPNVVVTNTSAGHTAAMSTTLVNFNNISLNININAGATFNFGNVTFLWFGTTLTNDGTFTHNGGSSNFVTFLTTAPQTITGSGTFTAPLSNIGIQSTAGLILTPANQIPVLGIRLFSGSVTNANKFTLGNGGATTGIVQVGNTTTPTAAGTFDVPFTFNLGTGGQTLSYLRTANSRVTGPEINPARTVTSFTRDENDPLSFLTIAGGNLTVTGAMALTNGIVLTGSNTLIHNGAASRTSGYIDGNLSRSYTAAGAYTYFVGQGGYTPVLANVTAGTFPSSLLVRSFDATLSGFNPATSLSRNWQLEETGDLTADLTFNYLDPGDVNGNETDYRVYSRNSGGVVTNHCPGSPCVNAAGNASNTLTGISTFSRWTMAELLTPTAASASVGGRVLTADGRPIANVIVTIAGDSLGQPISMATGHLGYYEFNELPVGESYVVTVNSKRFIFTNPTRIVTLTDNIIGADFVADPVSGRRR